MKFTITILIFFSLVSNAIFAQKGDSTNILRQLYDQNTIIPLSTGLMKNGGLINNAPFKSALKQELKQTPDIVRQYNKGMWQTWGGVYMATLGGGLTSMGGLFMGKAVDREERSAGLVTLVLGGFSTIHGTNLLSKASNNINNAVWLHNRSLILKAAKNNPALDASKVADLYDRNTLQFVSNGFYVNGRYQNFGFLDKNLHRAMQHNSLAMAHLKKARTNKILATGLNIVGLSSILYATSTTNVLKSPWFWGGYAVTFAGSFRTIERNNQLAKAVWFYNRDAFSRNY